MEKMPTADINSYVYIQWITTVIKNIENVYMVT